MTHPPGDVQIYVVLLDGTMRLTKSRYRKTAKKDHGKKDHGLGEKRRPDQTLLFRYEDEKDV